MPVPGDTGSAIRCPQVEEAAEIHQEGEWEPRPQQMAADRGDAQRSSSMQPGAAPASGHCWELGGSRDANRVVITSLWRMRLGTGSC